MRFVDWNHEVQTFPARTADQTFTKSIRLWRLARRLQYAQT